MSPKMKIREIIEVEALREEWQSLTRRIFTYLDNISSFFPIVDKISETDSYFQEVDGLFSDYNNLSLRTKKVLEAYKFRTEVLPQQIFLPIDIQLGKRIILKGKLSAALHRMDKECKRILKLLEGLPCEIMLSPEKEKELEMLRQIVKNEIEKMLPNYARDLNLSIEAFRKACFLGSCLIVGRIIDAILDEIKNVIQKRAGKEKSEIKWEEVESFLKKEVLGKEGAEKIIRGVKLYRNKFSHEVGTYPSPEDCLIMISSAIILTKGFIKWKKSRD